LSEIRSGEDEYEIFTSPAERKELYVIGRRLSEYAIKENIGAVYFMDRSARPAYVAMKAFWKIRYPDMPIPTIGFLNPKGFVSREDLESGVADLAELMLNDKQSQGEAESTANIRPQQEIIDEIKVGIEGKDQLQKPVLIFNTCMHTGDSLRPVLSKMEEAGIVDVRFGVVSSYGNHSEFEPDFTALDEASLGVCYPFDEDTLTSKTYSSIYSAPSVTIDSLSQGKILRKEIRQSVREFAV
jgi:hypothetical protein